MEKTNGEKPMGHIAEDTPTSDGLKPGKNTNEIRGEFEMSTAKQQKLFTPLQLGPM
jgi:hypothetical protein